MYALLFSFNSVSSQPSDLVTPTTVVYGFGCKVKEARMGWVCSIPGMKERRNARRILVGKPLGRRPLF
jgi:hypothetical protein